MNNLIDETYFVNDINIPNTDRPNVSSTLEAAITKYQKEVLIDVLGWELYELFSENITEAIYVSIIEGKDFTFEFNGKQIKRHWKGLQNEDLESLIAYFVYCRWIESEITLTTGIGEILSETQVGTVISPRDKYVAAYNNMVRVYGNIYDQKYMNTIQKMSLSHYLMNPYELDTYIHFNDEPSLYNFLLANKDDYPTWEFTPKERINVFEL